MSNAKEKLSDLLGYYLPPIDRSRCMPYVNGKCNGMCAECTAEQLIANGVTVQKWIPVSEPPKESGEYIVMIHRAANPTALLYNAESKSWFEVTIEDGEEVSTYYPVDYWMPLPEPPKGE